MHERQRQDDEVGHAARGIHQRPAVAAARHQPLDVGVLQLVAPHRLDDQIAHLGTVARRTRAMAAMERKAALDMRVELEDHP